jgi:hypothetical protein
LPCPCPSFSPLRSLEARSQASHMHIHLPSERAGRYKPQVNLALTNLGTLTANLANRAATSTCCWPFLYRTALHNTELIEGGSLPPGMVERCHPRVGLTGSLSYTLLHLTAWISSPRPSLARKKCPNASMLTADGRVERCTPGYYP